MKLKILKALACESRLMILEYLKEPNRHFPEQAGFDLVGDGVWNKLISQKLGICQESVTLHMQTLCRAGLVTSRKSGLRTFYKRDEQRINEAVEAMREICKSGTRS